MPLTKAAGSITHGRSIFARRRRAPSPCLTNAVRVTSRKQGPHGRLRAPSRQSPVKCSPVTAATIAEAKAREEAEAKRQAETQERERIAALNAAQKAPEPVAQVEPQKQQNTVQEIAKPPTKLTEFDMWWFEIGKELFKQTGIS